ncbi:MAG: baseplate J/gp47 family protein [Intestinimonas sp.]
MKLSVLGADFLPGSSTLVEKVQNAIDPPPNQGLGLGLAPIGAKVTAVAPTGLAVNVSATLPAGRRTCHRTGAGTGGAGH